jgi:hypothetical protein
MMSDHFGRLCTNGMGRRFELPFEILSGPKAFLHGKWHIVEHALGY